MIPAEAFAATTGLIVFLGFPLARWASERLVARADTAWQESSLEWLEGQGAQAPDAPSAPTYPPLYDWPWRAVFTTIGGILGYDASGPASAALFTAMCLAAATAALADLRAQILPDLAVGILGLLAIVLSVVGEGPAPVDALIGLAAGGGAFWAVARAYAIFRKREGLGLGDVKLFAVAGLAVGWIYLPFVALLAVFITISMMVLNDLLNWTEQVRTPFGPGIAASLLSVMAF